MTQLPWGILGTGNIARQFAESLRSSSRAQLLAVASRNPASAHSFATAHNIPHAHPDYDSLLQNPDVHAVYIALPNSLHHPWTLAALRAGKHVLCEKPLASDLAQAREMFHAASQHNRLLVEAFMFRSHPLTHAWLQQIRSGAIGQIRLVRASFCFCSTKPDGNIRFDRQLAGGALMDVGSYCVHVARLIAACEPSALHASAKLHDSGVDELTAATLTFPTGLIASLTCGMSVHADNTLSICGSEGYIQVPIPWKPPSKAAQYILTQSIPPRMDGAAPAGPPPRQSFDIDANLPLYTLEADEFAAAVLDHKPPAVTPADTLGNMAALDELRRQIGVNW